MGGKGPQGTGPEWPPRRDGLGIQQILETHVRLSPRPKAWQVQCREPVQQQEGVRLGAAVVPLAGFFAHPPQEACLQVGLKTMVHQPNVGGALVFGNIRQAVTVLHIAKERVVGAEARPEGAVGESVRCTQRNGQVTEVVAVDLDAVARHHLESQDGCFAPVKLTVDAVASAAG